MIDRFSGLMGLFAFFLTAVLGLLIGRAVESVLLNALIAMVAFMVVGKVSGFLARRIIIEVVEMIPEEELAGIEADEMVEGERAVAAPAEEMEELLPEEEKTEKEASEETAPAPGAENGKGANGEVAAEGEEKRERPPAA